MPGTATAATDGFERLDVPVVEYHEDGGKCLRRGCKNDAPYVVMVGKRIKLPCASHAEQERAAWEEEERAARAALFMMQAGSTERMKSWSFETYARDCADSEGRAALAFAQRWVKTYRDTGTGSNVLLWGPVGTGKTGLAWSMVRDLCESGLRARVVNFAALLAAIKDCYSKHIPTTHAMECHRIPVLVLDDLGAERPTEWACGELLGIVNERYERGLPTIYVSNYSPGVLAERLGREDAVIGERIVSRMVEHAAKFEFHGKDRRLAA